MFTLLYLGTLSVSVSALRDVRARLAHHLHRSRVRGLRLRRVLRGVARQAFFSWAERTSGHWDRSWSVGNCSPEVCTMFFQEPFGPSRGVNMAFRCADGVSVHLYTNSVHKTVSTFSCAPRNLARLHEHELRVAQARHVALLHEHRLRRERFRLHLQSARTAI